MKRNQLLRVTSIAFAVISLTACFGSGGGDGDKKNDPAPTCVGQAASEITAFNIFDLNAASPYFNTAVANFTLTQAYQTYPTHCNQDSYGATSLTITNGVNKTISFSYQIIATIGVVSWQYQNIVTIPANGSVNVGVINSNVQRLHAGAVVAHTSVITYN